MAETSDSFKAYGVSGHRHLPEIRQALGLMAGSDVGLTFVPHLVPMIRGIESTLYARLSDTSVDLTALYRERYSQEPFVDVMPEGSLPETRSVRGSNEVRIACYRPQDGNTAVILVVEDNLVKGAAGQAVQNMNLMFGKAETLGLQSLALWP
jgi:N-acetyl-gamma-glutamyl-phosphate reductase